MSKRARFFIISLILGFFLWLTGLFGVEKRLALVLSVSGIAYVLSAWVLFEDLKGWEWVTLLILPVLFTLGTGLFGNLLPSAIPSIFGLSFQIETSLFLGAVVRFIFVVLYVFGMYAVLLTENIFSVASIRTIQLFRAARSVSFILALVVSLFFFAVAFSLKLPFYIIGVIVGLVSLLLSFESLWSVDLKTEHLDDVYRLSIVIGWLMGLFGCVISFWPIGPFMGGLVLTSCFYALLGILEQRLVNKMMAVNYLEFVIFNLIIILIAFLTTSWRG
ncbi:hypothetical protein A2703_02795 [Candidatus Collierbacteria bacterium RIFCSPHIGHO2_01_FULL_50_25]|uniref:Uncharacterized protein n=1 Tax=Candidatus Collierbacteria bacterium RIFCSPHIGHO2_01_FULL_50_25 TaxID=1817722 RepID=A0A1F5EY21_9BACT|nr:MAG: hypothetical protein A2703_02795 [Candidatus Collierbacteria bacterium RIFCSPHIGHO2_01_FULL_50_25]